MAGVQSGDDARTKEAVPEEMLSLYQMGVKQVEKAVQHLDLPEGALVCQLCRASLAQMASDLAAVGGLRSNVLLRVQELTAPEEQIERVRVSEAVGVGTTLGTEDEVEELLTELRDYLLKLIASGVKVVLE